MKDWKIARRCLRRVALTAAAYGIGALVTVLVGEMLFRGGWATLQWCVTAPAAVLCSALFVELCQMALTLVFTRCTAWSLLSLIYWVFSLADRAKFSRLGTPAMPSDLLLSSQYGKLAFMLWGWHWIWIAVVCGLSLVIIGYWLKRSGARFFSIRSMGFWGMGLRVICLASVVLLVTGPDYNFKNARFRHSVIASQLDSWGISNLNWDPVMNVMTNGQLLAFLMNAKSALPHRPSGYGAALVATALDQTPPVDDDPHQIERPDVIVIMSEALWDPMLLPKVRYSDLLFGRLKYAKRGTLFSPVFGGYTANTEFEFLTRLSNAYLPAGGVPYMQYINRPLSSLARDFVAHGYQATALHPFDGHFWNRDSVYPHLGFSRFVDGRGFVAQKRTPPYISDASMAKEIIAVAEQGASPHFIFTVSVQNHGPYLDGATRYASESRVEVFDDSGRLTSTAKDILSTYATGVRDAVCSFDEVVNFYRKNKRPAIVMMFGDHLPFLGDDFMVYRQTGYLSTANQSQWTRVEQERMHGTPIVVWSNEPKVIALPRESVSPIYLGTMLKLVAGMPRNSMDVLLTHLMAQYPVLAQFYSRNSSGEVYEGAAPRKGVVAGYSAIVYDELFGENYATKLIHEGSGANGESLGPFGTGMNQTVSPQTKH